MLDLRPQDHQEVRQILDRHLPHREVRVFGSRVTNQAKPYSDLDLVIMGDELVAASTMAHLALDFEESDLPFRVDLLQWRNAPTSLRQVIKQASEPI